MPRLNLRNRNLHSKKFYESEMKSLSKDIFNTVKSHGSFAFDLINYIAVVDDISKPYVSENLNEIVQITEEEKSITLLSKY